MNKTVKKIIFVVVAVWWSFGIIGDVLQKDSVTSNIWGQYHATWGLVILDAINIAFLLYAAFAYLREDKIEAYKYFIFAVLVNLIEGSIELILVSMIDRGTLTNWITLNRQARGLPILEVPSVVNNLTWGYLFGFFLDVITMYFVYRHIQKLKRLQKKSNSIESKKEKGKK